MRTHIRCGHLFDGLGTDAVANRTLILEDGVVQSVVATAEAPPPASGDRVVDHGGEFVLPGLIDIHVHLSYGNAQANEDIDMYATPEYRALRAVRAAQRVLAAGYTSLADPASTGHCSASVRDAINAGLFHGPRITCSGRQITSRQGLGDWYPSWIGVPESSVGVLVRNVDEAVEEIRLQVKNRMDFIKITADGLHRNPSSGELMACFNQGELSAMVEECHRLGRKVITHARGREAVLYSARAGVDIIFHAFEMDEECTDAVLESGSCISPALTFLVNTIDFTQPGDPCYRWRPNMNRRDVDGATEALSAARAAGVPFLVGTDSGFAVTPYGEWHSRELEIMVDQLGFSPGEALQATTSGNATLLREGEKVGRVAPGAHADLTVVRADPLADIAALGRRENLSAVYRAGEPVELPEPDGATTWQWEHSFRQWNDVYTRERVADLGIPVV